MRRLRVCFCIRRSIDVSPRDLETHKEQKQKRRVTLEEGTNYCGKCNREFKDAKAYKYHIKRSLKHNPIARLRCPLSMECSKIFGSPSALVMHLESGACKSGMDREKLNVLTKELDNSRMITAGEAIDTEQGMANCVP